MTACIGEPISWPRLEAFALDARDARVAAHLASCPACARCLDEIRRDVVALPPLVIAAPARRAWRWRAWWGPALALAAAAVLAVALWPARPGEPLREEVARVKGIGEVVIDVVRERDGAIRLGVRTYAPGDRWKLVVTCPPSASGRAIAVDVTVTDAGQVDRPLAPAQIACGNQVAIPGAFSITGDRANRVCAEIHGATACLTLRPEPATR